MNCDLEGSFIFLWEFLQRYLSFRKCFLEKYYEARKEKEEELGRFGCVGIASHSQGVLPNFQGMVFDDRKLQLFEPEIVLDIQRKEN